MKTNIQVVILLAAFAVLQACGSKSESASAESGKASELQLSQRKTAEELAEQRAIILQASMARAEERSRAAAERGKLTPTFKDALGQVVYFKAEVNPSYNGGDEAIAKYLHDNLKYPAEARENGQQGTVFVDFIVDSRGKVREVVASDVIGENVDLSLKEEAVRVVASMPGWNAGLQQSKAVDVAFSIPISFEIR